MASGRRRGCAGTTCSVTSRRSSTPPRRRRSTQRWPTARREVPLLTLAERLGGSLGGRVGVHVVGAGRVDGRLLEVSDQWLPLAGDLAVAGAQVLVAMSAVQSVAGLTDLGPTSAPGGSLRLGLGVALRTIARDRSPVVVSLTGGGTVEGTLELVARTSSSLTEHLAGEVRPRRPASCSGPFGARHWSAPP